ncbi:MAG TPA: serine/threonine-protein kinase [Candidatus Thermoplasmatota archaeon]
MDFLPALSGLLHATVAVYLLFFRPRTVPILALATTLLFLGIAHTFSGNNYMVVASASFIGIGAFLLLCARFPRPMTWRKASSVVFVLATAWWLAGAVYYVIAVPPEVFIEPTFMRRLLGPGSMGITILLTLFVLLRLRDLPHVRDDAARAASLVYLFPLTLVITGGGFQFGELVFKVLSPDRTFYPANPQWENVIIGHLGWWFLPTILAVYCWSRWRWWLPAGLIALGFLSYVPLMFQPDLDAGTRYVLVLWGGMLAPGLVMYAQARWAPFTGEPTRLGPTAAMTGFTALFTGAFVFVLALTLSPTERVGYSVAPVVALLAAVGAALLVLPRARKLDLRQILSRAGGPSELRPGAVLLGRYHIVRLLGQGGQGSVYEATDKKNRGERVVLKALPDQDAVLEAGILQGLNHPNIVEFRDVVRIPGFTLLILEYADGGTLRNLLTRRAGHIPSEEADTIVDGVLSGLAQAHAHGVIHHDVKPENVLLDANGVPKLADFGIARPASTSSTANAARRGTLGYLSPEQVRGDIGDARSDVYAAGVLVYEVLTGKQPIPIQGDDDFLTRKAILQQSPRIQLPPGLKELARLLRRALAKDPNERPADAADFLAQLKAARPGSAS